MSLTILVCESLPGLSASGGSITAFNMARALNNLNESFLILSLFDYWPELGAKKQHYKELEDAGLQYICANELEDNYSDNDGLFIKSELYKLQQLYTRIEHVHAYGHRAALAVASIKNAFKFTMHSYLGDPMGAPNTYKNFSDKISIVDPISLLDKNSLDTRLPV